MLSTEENEQLTHVGPGTPMGELLRRYWQPVGCTERVTKKPQRVKVMGEEFVLYRGESGAPVLMQLRCAHRSLALDYGRVEGDSLRCSYHGWLYDKSGQCLAQPAEPERSSFKDKIKLKSYPTQEISGLVFAYLRPDRAPLLPLYDILRMNEGVKVIHVQNINANWLNHVENILDTAHLTWLHGYTLPSYHERRAVYRWDRKDYGLDNVSIWDGVDEPHISCYAFPNINRFSANAVEKGGELVRSMIYRVPIDDASTLLYFIRYYPSEKRSLATHVRTNKVGEYAPLAADWWGINFNDQDRMAAEQQGAIADRTSEHLGASDRGIIMMRQMLRESLSAIAAGTDPHCLIRDPAKQIVDFAQKPTLSGNNPDNADVVYDLALRDEKERAAARAS
jgi:5,5'-dehydrodivanillate O-demethylase oxygenase subunit